MESTKAGREPAFFVQSCDGRKVFTIEGNASDRVKRLSYRVGAGEILGYGVPKY